MDISFLTSIYREIYQELNARIYGEPDNWNYELTTWLHDLPIHVLHIDDWQPIAIFIAIIILLIFGCRVIRKVNGRAFVSSPESLPEIPILSTETSDNQEDSQIPPEMTELDGKPVEIFESIQENWSHSNYNNCRKLYVLTLDMDPLEKSTAEINEIFDESSDYESGITLEARNVVEEIISEVESFLENSENNIKSTIDITSVKGLDFNNESINSHVESRTCKAGSKIPLRVGSRHRVPLNKSIKDVE